MSGIAALAAEHRWVNAGLDRADSYCTNPKWMGINFAATFLGLLHRRALLGALSILHEYLRSQQEESGAVTTIATAGPLGRRFGPKLWFHLRIDGRRRAFSR